MSLHSNFSEAWSDLLSLAIGVFDGFDIFLTALCQLSDGFLAWIAIEEQKWEHELCFSMNYQFLVRREEINDKFLWQKLSCNCSARAAVWSYAIVSYLGSNGIFKIFNSKWSYDKMLIDWVRSGRTGKYLALDRSGSTDLEPNIFPSGHPTQSILKYIVFAWAPSTRSSSLLTSCSSFLCFLSSGSEGKRWSISKSKLGKVFFIWIP